MITPIVKINVIIPEITNAIADITIPAIDVPLLGSFVLFFFVVSIIDKIKPTIANIRASILTIGTQPNTSEIIPNTNPAIPIFYSSI